jgi:uncharacterized membrane protein
MEPWSFSMPIVLSKLALIPLANEYRPDLQISIFYIQKNTSLIAQQMIIERVQMQPVGFVVASVFDIIYHLGHLPD